MDPGQGSMLDVELTPDKACGVDRGGGGGGGKSGKEKGVKTTRGSRGKNAQYACCRHPLPNFNHVFLARPSLVNVHWIIKSGSPAHFAGLKAHGPSDPAALDSLSAHDPTYYDDPESPPPEETWSQYQFSIWEKLRIDTELGMLISLRTSF
ncbi:hypothetical protein PM082_005880 [Marasmius tenuissimus]|nr:hypothetical protein PM082_005880 [Marasmius tenuissimus]